MTPGREEDVKTGGNGCVAGVCVCVCACVRGCVSGCVCVVGMCVNTTTCSLQKVFSGVLGVVRVCRGYVCEHDFLKTVCVNGTPHMAHTLLICFFFVSFVFVVL